MGFYQKCSLKRFQAWIDAYCWCLLSGKSVNNVISHQHLCQSVFVSMVLQQIYLFYVNKTLRHENICLCDVFYSNPAVWKTITVRFWQTSHLCTELGLGYSNDELHHRRELGLKRRDHVDDSCELLWWVFTCAQTPNASVWGVTAKQHIYLFFRSAHKTKLFSM